jgi:hypothetical protein
MADLVIRNALLCDGSGREAAVGEFVFVNGTPVVERGVPTDRRPGRVLRGGV